MKNLKFIWPLVILTVSACSPSFNPVGSSKSKPASPPPVYSCSKDIRSRYIAPNENHFIYNGSNTPESQGWIHDGGSNCSEPGCVSISLKGNSEYYMAESKSVAVNEYLLDTGIRDSFYVSIRVAIESAASNLHDAGFSFSPIGSTDPWHYDFVWPDRVYGLYIDPCQIGFQDYSASYNVNATLFHTYLIVYKNSQMNVYIDNSYEEVAAGQATPVLSRSILNYNDTLRKPGVIVFGDSTNDVGLPGTYNQISNSKFRLDYVTFSPITGLNHKTKF